MKTILCFGDSNTHGFVPQKFGRYPKDVRWPGLLAKLLGPEYSVIEEGCNGRTTMFTSPKDDAINGLPYLKPCLISHKPLDYVILMLGTNDSKQEFGLDAAKIADAAGVLVKVIQNFGNEIQGVVPEIILVAPARIGENYEASPFYPDFDKKSFEESKKFAAEYKRVADELGCRFYDAADVDISPFDSVHFTEKGHRMLAEGLAAEILKDK